MSDFILDNIENLKTVIIGAGGQARIIVDIFQKNQQNLLGYISSEEKGTIINGYPVLCSIEELINENNILKVEAAIISIGDNIMREKIVESLSKLNIKFVNAIHPKAVVSEKAKIGRGVLINAQAIIQTHSIIKDHCNIGTGAIVEHDCYLNNYVNIAPNVTLCGNVHVGELSVIGPSATVLEKTSIGRKTIIGAGAVLLDDVGDEGVFMGIPAKFTRVRNQEQSYLK